MGAESNKQRSNAEKPIFVRQTKEDALPTHHTPLNAAEWLFQAQDVSRTSLNDNPRPAPLVEPSTGSSKTKQI